MLKIEAEEAEEDILQASGTPYYFGTSYIFTALQRIKWLITNLISCAINSAIMMHFIGCNHYTECVAIIAGIAAVVGACAMQTGSTTTRKLVRKTLNHINIWQNLRKELRISLMMAIIINSLFASYIYALTCSATFTATTIPILITLLFCGTLFGVLLPFFASRIGIDPVLISPVLTAITDVLTPLIVFFYISFIIY